MKKRRRTNVDYLLDILDISEKAQQFIEGVGLDDFQADAEKVYAVSHALQIIGEAARHLPRSLRERYSDTPWDDIIGMRDIVVHDYFGVDLEILWRAVHDDLPPLRDAVKKILEELPDDEK